MSASIRASEAGSAPVELIAWAVLLTLPLFPAIELQRAIADQMAAEAIARHALRAAVLAEPESGLPTMAFRANIERTALEIARAFRVDANTLELSVDCSACESDQLVRLAVSVNGRSALGVMGLEPITP